VNIWQEAVAQAVAIRHSGRVPAPAEFAAVYDRHVRDVLRTANDVLRDRRLAEEVTHDVFLALWRDRGHDPARGDMGPYLRTLARNRAVDVWRRSQALNRTTRRFGVAHAGGGPAAADPVDEALRNEMSERTRAAIMRLPREQRTAIALAYWGGLTMQEAAERQGIPLGTAKSRVRLALLRLAADPAFRDDPLAA
jgi:RNA polymerase sigma-70 factor (ECF subfamily)